MANPKYNHQTTPKRETGDGWNTKAINEYKYGRKNGLGAYDISGSSGMTRGGKGSKATFSRKGKRGQSFEDEFRKSK